MILDRLSYDDDKGAIGVFRACPLLRAGEIFCLCRMFAKKGVAPRDSSLASFPREKISPVCVEETSCGCG